MTEERMLLNELEQAYFGGITGQRAQVKGGRGSTLEGRV